MNVADILADRRLTRGRRLTDVKGMMVADWRRVYVLYMAFVMQVRLLVAEIEAREEAKS